MGSVRSLVCRLLFVASAAALSAPCTCSEHGRKPPRKPEPDPIPLGACLPLSGMDEYFGIETRRGVQLAVAELNESGGLDGRRVQLFIRDDGSDKKRARELVTELIDEKDALALIGEIDSAFIMPSARVAQRSGVVMLSPLAGARKVTDVGDYVFTLLEPALQSRIMARFALEDLEARRVAVFKPFRSYSHLFIKAFKEMGGTIVPTPDATDESGFDIGGEDRIRAKLKAARAGDAQALLVPLEYYEVLRVARTARDMGTRLPLLGPDTWTAQPAFEDGNRESVANGYYATRFWPDDSDPRVRTFMRRFRKRYGEQATTWAAVGYDAARVLLDAIRRADPPTRRRIRDALANTRAYQGVTGTLRSFDRNGRPQLEGMDVIRVERGDTRFVKHMKARPKE